jgi:hypothetical protein
LEIGFPLDVEKIPSEVMQLEHGEDVRLISDGLLDGLGVLIKSRLPSGDDLRDDGEAVASRSLGKIGPYLPCSTLSLDKPPLGIALAAGFVQSPCLDLSDITSSFHSSAR